MSALREVLAAFSIEVDDKELEEFDKGVRGFVGRMQRAGEVVVEALALKEVGEFFERQIEMAARVQDLSDKLGVSTDALQRFQYAAKSVGVDGESAAHSLGFLNRSVGEAIDGTKESVEAFAKLHVTLKDTAGKARPVEDVLMDVSDGLAKLPDQQTRAAYAMKLFGREGQTLLPILSQGSEKIRETYKEADELGIILGGEFFKNAHATREEMEHFEMMLQALKARILSAALPAITALFKYLQAKIKPVQDLVKNTNILQHVMETLAAGGALKLIMTLIKLSRAFGILQPTIWRTVLSLMGFALPVVAIGILYLLFEDLFTLLEGGDSVIGDLLTELGGVEGKNKFVQDLTESWTDLKQLWDQFVGMDPLAFMAGSVKFLVGGFYELVEIGKFFFDLLVGMADTVASVVIGFSKLGSAFSSMDKAGEGDKGFLTQLKDIGGAFASHFSGVGAANKEGRANTSADLDAIWNPGSHWKQHPAVQTMPGEEFDKGPGQADVGKISYGAPSVAAPANTGTKVDVGKIEFNVQVDGAGKDGKQVGQEMAQSAAETMRRNNYNTLFAQKKP